MPGGDTTTVERKPRSSRGRRFVMVFEPDRTLAFDLPERGRFVLGRAEDADVVLQDRSVSRRHAELIADGAQVRVRDLGSRNGVTVAGRKIQGEVALEPGDAVRIGSVVLELGDADDALRRHGIVAHAEFEARCAARLRHAREQGSKLSLYLVSAPNAEPRVVVDALRAIAGDEVLAGAYGGGHLLILAAPGDPSRLRSRLRGSGVRADVGHASFPSDGRSVDELVAAARSALRPAVTRERALVAVDPAARRVFDLARRVAAGRIPVLVTGETGSGKEVVADAIHRGSPRADRALVRLNCAALPEPLLEAELFGYEKGAFTGAVQAKPGLFEAADGGTLFLDEVGDLPLSQQAKLLRVLEDGTIRRLGGLKDRRVDVRVVAATNRDLEEACERGAFRQDLFFRLSGTTLVVPPLRDCPENVLPLARHFAEQAGHAGLELAPETERLLLRHSWPGNARELRNAIERALLLADGVVLPEHLPDRVRLGAGPRAPEGKTTPPARGYGEIKGELRDLERSRILEALEACDWNQTRAAQHLGMARRTLVGKLAALGIARRDRRPKP